MQQTTNHSSVLARLRAMTPPRGLDQRSALGLAERQANTLLGLRQVTTPPVSLDLLARLPRIELALVPDLPTIGASYWTGDAWRLEANADDHSHRQRFTLAHEYKHVIDHPFRDLLYATDTVRERAADQFAACLLMPKVLVIRAWCSGEQNLNRLAEQFAVSQTAIARRVSDLGLSDCRLALNRCVSNRRYPLRSGRPLAIAGVMTIGDMP